MQALRSRWARLLVPLGRCSAGARGHPGVDAGAQWGASGFADAVALWCLGSASAVNGAASILVERAGC